MTRITAQSKNLKKATFLLLIACLSFCAFSLSHQMIKQTAQTQRVQLRQRQYPIALNYERKDWHDWKLIEYEKTRGGLGEQGKPVTLTDKEEIALNEKMFEVEGLFVVVSEKISVNRSVLDTRNPKCKLIEYFTMLPKASVIVIFHNEHLSVLLRTIHSIYNRTPHELLHEILLVNDASTKRELYEPLLEHVRGSFDSRVKVVNLKQRSGLIVTRMEGARRATGEVLVFFDSHVEVNVNWLPPLLGRLHELNLSCTSS